MKEQKTVYDVVIEKIMKLGIDPAIKDNPAFSKIIADIARKLPDVDMDHVRFDINDEGLIYISNKDDKYTCKIQSTDSNSFSVKVNFEQQITKQDGRPGMYKHCVEKKVELKGGVDLKVTSYSASAKDSVDGIVYPESRCEEKWYTKNGVVRDIEERRYNEQKIDRSYEHRTVENLDEYNILMTPRDFPNNFDKKTQIHREGFDVAHVYEEDKQGNTLYSANVQIDNEYGVSNMDIKSYYREVDSKIEPFSPELVEIIIKRERDPRTQEELRSWAKTQNRESYSYDATMDPNYVNASTK